MNVKKALFASSLFLCGAGVLPVTAGLPVPHDESEISSPMPEQQKKNRSLPVMSRMALPENRLSVCPSC